MDAIRYLFGSSLIKSRLLRSFNFIFLWKARQPFHWTIFQNKMDLYFTFLWLNCGTAFLLIPPITTASNQMETPLIFINNIFMENFSIENHTIQTESVRAGPLGVFSSLRQTLRLHCVSSQRKNMWASGHGHWWGHREASEKTRNCFVSCTAKRCEGKFEFM